MKNFKMIAGSILAIIVVVFIATAFTNKEQEAPQYMQITALETHIKGGFGRSSLVISYPDSQEESELMNYQSMTGINFANVKNNEKKIVAALNKATSMGYKMKWLESGVSEGIYVTKYVFVKE